MSMTKTMTAWIRLVATPTDKALLEAISARNGDAGFSATVRRLIREEAGRRGIVAGPTDRPGHRGPTTTDLKGNG